MKDKTDLITIDVPLMIRLLEFAKEDAKDDMELHSIAERLIKLSKQNNPLSMVHYDSIVKSDKKKLTESMVIKKMGGTSNSITMFITVDSVTVGGIEMKKVSDDTYTIMDYMTRDDVDHLSIIGEVIRRIFIKNPGVRLITVATNEDNRDFWAKVTNNNQIKDGLYAFVR